MADPVGSFHAHLDGCRQCRENPFDLCPEGRAALEEAASKGFRQARPANPKDFCMHSQFVWQCPICSPERRR